MWIAALIVCLMTLLWTDSVQDYGANTLKVHVKEGSDVILPCSQSSKQNLEEGFFDWKNDRGKVFLYDAGHHDNNADMGQEEQFKGRVSHFPEQLKHGNASIKIRQAKRDDSGTYTCIFPFPAPGQRHSVELVVGAGLETYLRIINQTTHRALLHCEVTGAVTKPQVAFRDRAGNQLSAVETNSTQSGDCLNITLQTSITETGCYRCVVTQEDVGHQVSGETCWHISGGQPGKTYRLMEVIGWSILSSIIGAFLGYSAFFWMNYNRMCLKRCCCVKHEPEADDQSSQHQHTLIKSHDEDKQPDHQQQSSV